MNEHRIVETSWGHCAYVVTGRGLRATFLPARRRADVERLLRSRYHESHANTDLLPDLADALVEYFAGQEVTFEPLLDLEAFTPFAQRVLRACRRIPWGRTATYGDLARRAGQPQAARAVGAVMAHNPLPLVIPCHRVIRSDGGLGGFSAPQGQTLKRRLLRLEAIPEPVPAR